MSADARSRSTLRVIGASAAAALFAVWYILWLYLPAFNTTHAPLEGVLHPPSRLKTTPSVARRLVLMLVDGVSYEAARSLEELMPLRREGVMRPLVVEFPSYTDPAITSFVTGLDPADSGMRLNGKVTGAPDLDAVTIAAAEAGVPVKVRSRGWEAFEDLVRARGADASHSQVFFQAELSAAEVRGWPHLEPADGLSPAREISLIYIVEADKAAHLHGGASDEFKSAAHFAGSLVARYAKTLDLEQDVLVVVSDHGHTAAGGHGGVEPEILRSFFLAAGSFIRHGVELHERPLRDVASTLSVLGGLRVPSSNLGRPMLDVMALEDDQRSYVLAAPFDEASRLLCALHSSPRCDQREPLIQKLHYADAAAGPAAEALLDTMMSERRASIAKRAERRASIRISVTAALVLALIALLVRRARPGDRIAAVKAAASLLVIPALHAALFTVGLYVQGYRPSFSSLKTQPLFYRDATYASVAAIVATLLVTRALRRNMLRDRELLGAWITLAATITPVALLAAWLGFDPKIVPPPVEGVLLLQIAPIILSAGILASLIAALRPRAAAPAIEAAPSTSERGATDQAAA